MPANDPSTAPNGGVPAQRRATRRSFLRASGLAAAGFAAVTISELADPAPGSFAATGDPVLISEEVLAGTYTPSVTVGSYYGPFGSGDDQLAFENAIDAIAAQGGGKLIIPPTPGYVPTVQQLVLPTWIELTGGNWNTFGRSGNTGRLAQASGVNVDTIVFSNDVLTQYGAARPFVGPLGIHDLVLSKPGNAGGHHIAVRTADGREAKLQDFSTFERLGFRGGAGSGMYINGGSPIVIRNVVGIGLGGYVIELVDRRRDPTHGDIHQVSVESISGDACMGYAQDAYGAVVLLEGTLPFTTQTFRGIKSEYRRRNRSDGGNDITMGNRHALILDSCESVVTVSGIGHVATGSSPTNPQEKRPGAAILIRGTRRPKLEWDGVNVRVTAQQTAGALPGAVRDEVSSAAVDIPNGVGAGSYSTTTDRRDTVISTGSSRWLKGAPGQAFPSVASPLTGLSGVTPTRSWWENHADQDEKLWSMLTSSGNISIRTHLDDGSPGVVALEIVRAGAKVMESKFGSKVSVSGLDVTDSSAGVVLKAPNGKRFRVTVNNAGALIVGPA